MRGFVFLVLAACASQGSPMYSQEDTSLPICTIPPGDCRTARTSLECGPNDAGTYWACISDDPTQCASAGLIGECLNQCASDEYGAACGHVGPSTEPWSLPSLRCRQIAPTPAGIVFYCCPCQP